jgi:arginyl-tRNA synthetase
VTAVKDLYGHVQEQVTAVVGKIPAEVQHGLGLQAPKDLKFGDVALPCFPLAKVKSLPPVEVAADIAAKIAPDDVIESVTATGPFVNFRFRRDRLAATVITQVLSDEPPFGQSPPSGEKIVIDYSSPNIAKPFHMGHLRSTVIGAALRRIHRHLGHEVFGINHLGDWGSQFGKVITAFLLWGSEAELEKDPMRHLFEIYVRYGKEADKDPSLDEESAQHFRRLESGEDNEERKLWQRLRTTSLEAFQGPYGRLGVDFDAITGESFYQDKMTAAVERVRKAGILTESEGAQVVDLKTEHMPPCLLVKTDGTTLYATRDLAAIFYRIETFRFDRALYLVGNEQKLHFRQLKAVLEKMGLPEAHKIEHVPFGLILSHNDETHRWEKFATRGGNAIFLDEVLDEAVAQVFKIIETKNPGLENKTEVAEKIGVSAIIFNDLKNQRIKDVRFDWEHMLNFEGETGPYVQYAGARLAGILRKAGADGERASDPATLASVDFGQLDDADRVLLAMLEFGPAVQRASDQNEPSIITNLMIQLASEIHSYLHEHNVIYADPELRQARLALVAAGRKVLRRGLGLLGVAAVDRM